jgi:hypothetical protein
MVFFVPHRPVIQILLETVTSTKTTSKIIEEKNGMTKLQNPPTTPPPSDSTVNIAAAGGSYKAQGTKYLCPESVLVWRVAVCEPNLTQFLDFLLGTVLQ